MPQGPEDQYGDDGSWWGDGDVAGDDIGDIEELVMPPDEDQETGDEREEEDGHLGGLSLVWHSSIWRSKRGSTSMRRCERPHDYAAN